jgi:retron-type reverse transcriptase
VCNGRDTWVLEADIKGFFDNIAHESILKELGNFPGRNLIKEWLKAGYEGFDFLGFNHRHYHGKLLIKPSKQKVLDFCTRIGMEIKVLKGVNQDVVIRKLNPILRGFAKRRGN